MKKIAIIRGANLNEFEMQNYNPLVGKGVELVGFTSKAPRYELKQIDFPVRKLPQLGDFSDLSEYQGFLRRLFGDDQVMVGLEKALEGFEIAHSAETFNYYTYQAIKAKLAGRVKKVVLTVWENRPLVGEGNPKQAQFKEMVLQNTDLFHAVTERARESLILDGAPAEKIRVFPYGVDMRRFRVSEKKSKDIVVLSVGRLVWEKGFDHILFAAKKLLQDPEVPTERLKFLIVGDGPRRELLEQQIKRLALEKNVTLIRRIPYEEMPKIHASADIFLLPSLPIPNWQEQFGMVFVESMASGKPVIAGRSGSIPEVIGEAGLLVQPGDMLSLAEALKKLVLNKNLRDKYGQAALKRAWALFDTNKVACKLSDLYNEL